MATPIFEVPNYDANQLLTLARALAGPVDTGDITADELFARPDGTLVRARWIYVGTSGDLSYTKYDGSTQVLIGILAGVWHPIHAIKVNSASTASDLVWGS